MKDINYELINKICLIKNYTFKNIVLHGKKNLHHVEYLCNKHIDKGELKTVYDNFINGVGCKYCANENIAKERSHKAKENFNKYFKDNLCNEYELLSEYIKASQKIRILHKTCGYEYETTPSKIINDEKCRICNGRFRNTLIFKDKVFKLVGNEYEILEEYINSSKKIKIKHIICGHEYNVIPNKFLSGNRCPYCHKGSNNKSKLAHIIESFLCLKQIDYKKEYRFNDCRNKLPLPFDFAIFNNNTLFCLIEADGIQHFNNDTKFGDNNLRIVNDNIKLIRIPYWDINNVNNILLNELDENLYYQTDNINLNYNIFDKETIIEIRKIYSLGNNSINSIAKLYNTTKYYISSILKYEIYPDIALEYKTDIEKVKNTITSWKKGKVLCVDNETQKEIKKLYLTGEYSMRKLGNIYKIDHHIVSRIIKN